MRIGVLAIQGDVYENIAAARAALGDAGTAEAVMRPEEMDGIDGLVIPGGESTVIGRLSCTNGTFEKIRERINAGMPVFGICAGLILLSKDARDRAVGKTDQPLLGVLDVKVERNAFGHQRESFEAELVIEGQDPSFDGVFIRAPSISSVGPQVRIICELDGSPVAVRQGSILGTTFHPELTGNATLYEYFIGMVRESKG